VLPGRLSEFGTEVHIVAKIIDPRDQAFQNERRFIAGQNKLTGVFRQITALKERKRHFGRLFEGMAEIVPQFITFPDVTIGTLNVARALALIR
jgi:hypothetical protein